MGLFLPTLFFLFSLILVVTFYWLYINKLPLNNYAFYAFAAYVLVSVVMFVLLKTVGRSQRSIGAV